MEVFILCSVVWSILTPSVSVHRQQRAHPTEIKNMLRKLRIVNGFEKRQRTRHLSKDKERRNNLLITLRKLRSESAATRYLKKFQ